MQYQAEQQQGSEQRSGGEQAPPAHFPIDDSSVRGARPLLAEAVAAAPLALLGLLLVASIWWEGAFDLRYWSPLTLLALALLLALVVAGTLSLPRGPLAVALTAIWALAAYTMLSAAWSESAAAAWEGAARMIFYAALFTLAVAAPTRGRLRTWIGTGLVLGVVTIGLVIELRLLAGSTGAFLAGRLNDPVGYRNGTGALFAFAAWPLLGVAARRGSGSGARAAALAAVVLVLGLAFLTQSRGILLGLACGGGVSLLIGPDRLRRTWLALAVVAIVALGSGTLLEPFHASGGGTGTAGTVEIVDAAGALLLLTAGTFVAGLLLFVFDEGLRSAQAVRAARGAALAGLVLLVAAAAVAGLAAIGNPASYAREKWDEFTRVESKAAGDTRFGTVGGPRYDIWRVALDQFREEPVLGGGEGSYRFAYYRERHTDRNVDNAHSLPLELLAETGLIGAGLFALWLGALAVAIGRRARAAESKRRAWIAGLAAAGTVVLAQATVDWLWLIPGLFGLGVMALALAARGEGGEARELGPRRPAPRMLAAIALGMAAVSVGSLFLSDLYVRRARQQAFTSTQASLSSARSAARLDPVSVTPLYLEASALETDGRRGAARRALLEALNLEPSNFATLGLLGDIEVRAGNAIVARRYYRRALALDPLDIGLQKLSRGD